jgi:hypothetical protein
MAIDGAKLSDSIVRVVTVRELKQHKVASNVNPTTATLATFTPSSVRFGAKKKRGGKR